MKKILVIALAAFALTGCSKDETSTPTLSVSPDAVMSLTAANESETLTVTSNAAWSASVTPATETWCTLSAASGTGNGMVTITAAVNTAMTSRTATITITTTSGTPVQTKTVAVTQAMAYFPAYPGVIGYDPATQTLNLDGVGVMVYFKFGSLVAMYAGNNGDKWRTDGNRIAFNPSNVTIGAYETVPYPDGVTFPAQNVAAGLGDPCKLVSFKANEVSNSTNSGWRLPTDAENAMVTMNQDVWVQQASPSDATPRDGHTFAGLSKGSNYADAAWNFLPAAGYRSYSAGSVGGQGTGGYYWLSEVLSSMYGYSLNFSCWLVYTLSNSNYAWGFPVRCVRQ